MGGRWDEEDGWMVVINGEEQYNIWPEEREPQEGWKPVGFTGTMQQCKDHIEEVWTDMVPKSLRAERDRKQAERRERELRDE